MSEEYSNVSYSVGILELWAGKASWYPIHRDIYDFDLALEKAKTSKPNLRIMRHTVELLPE